MKYLVQRYDEDRGVLEAYCVGNKWISMRSLESSNETIKIYKLRSSVELICRIFEKRNPNHTYYTCYFVENGVDFSVGISVK